jgi:hypothetical protein
MVRLIIGTKMKNQDSYFREDLGICWLVLGPFFLQKKKTAVFTPMVSTADPRDHFKVTARVSDNIKPQLYLAVT